MDRTFFPQKRHCKFVGPAIVESGTAKDESGGLCAASRCYEFRSFISLTIANNFSLSYTTISMARAIVSSDSESDRDSESTPVKVTASKSSRAAATLPRLDLNAVTAGKTSTRPRQSSAKVKENGRCLFFRLFLS